MKIKGPGSENEGSKGAKEMKIPSQFVNTDFGKPSKIVRRKVSITGAGGKLYGSRAILTKEDAEVVTFIDHLIAEASDSTELPGVVMSEIKTLISKGAKDLEQEWKNALELTYKAYEVAQVRRPDPTEKAAWKQFEQLLAHSVKSLSQSRGINGKWRTSSALVSEGQTTSAEVGIKSRRFFVEVPGESAREVDGNNMDEIIDAITNKIRTDRSVVGTKVRVEERSKKHAVLTIWVNDVIRDRITIKEVS